MSIRSVALTRPAAQQHICGQSRRVEGTPSPPENNPSLAFCDSTAVQLPNISSAGQGSQHQHLEKLTPNKSTFKGDWHKMAALWVLMEGHLNVTWMDSEIFIKRKKLLDGFPLDGTWTKEEPNKCCSGSG